MTNNGSKFFIDTFLPETQKVSHKPLDMVQLKRLFDLTDWRVVWFDERTRLEYNNYSTANLFKVLVLPYLLNIPTERALVRELQERPALQTLCGFSPGEQIPSRGTLWNFRNKYKSAYADIILRILIAMVLGGKKPNLDLPYVNPLSDTEPAPQGRYEKAPLFDYLPEIEVWSTIESTNSEGNHITARDHQLRESLKGKDLIEWSREIEKYENELTKREKKGIFKELSLPVEVRAKLGENNVIRFRIEPPEWIEIQTYRRDTLTSIGSTYQGPYTACNVIILRKRNGKKQILLSKRTNGYGKDCYTLPGGKQVTNESLQECAARELHEETGLILLKSRPISIQKTLFPGKPWVLSLGVLAEEEDYRGKLKTREAHQYTKWEWYDLDQLPKPLFEPTRIVISQFIEEKYRDLKWEDVEAERAKHPQGYEQLQLFDKNLNRR